MRNSASRLMVVLLAGTLILQQGGTGRTYAGPPIGVTGDRYPRWSPTGERIAFVSDRDAKPEIYIINADGKDVRRLTTSPPGVSSSSPAWSPDGRRIAYVSGVSLDSRVFVMNADGSDQRLLVSGRSWRPAWSPDGRKIAFESEPIGSSGASVITAEGGQQVNIASGVTMGRDIVETPSWSPDGKRLAFATWETEIAPTPGDESSGTFPVTINGRGTLPVTIYLIHKMRFYVIDADGRHPRTLTTVIPSGPVAIYSGPEWSPDGSRIAFVSVERGFPQIHAINPDGNGRVRLTSQGSNFDPVWSPDGRRIAFVSDREGKRHVFVMNADGSGQLSVTGSGGGDGPTWSPDGQRIAYASKRGELWRLYSVNADGTGETQLTEGW